MPEERVNPVEAYRELLRHGTMSVGLYQPHCSDLQRPHEQDEVYIIASGSGAFVCGAERTRFRPGDVLFAAAGETHRFEDFDEALSVWVVFYGPSGGEAANLKPHQAEAG